MFVFGFGFVFRLYLYRALKVTHRSHKQIYSLVACAKCILLYFFNCNSPKGSSIINKIRFGDTKMVRIPSFIMPERIYGPSTSDDSDDLE